MRKYLGWQHVVDEGRYYKWVHADQGGRYFSGGGQSDPKINEGAEQNITDVARKQGSP